MSKKDKRQKGKDKRKRIGDEEMEGLGESVRKAV
jgi:hypothetical protein